MVLSSKDSFGEGSFNENGKRKGTATAIENTVCFSLGKSDIKNCLGDSYSNILYFNIQKWALRQTKFFSEFNNAELDRIAAEFKLKHAKAHEVIAEKGKNPNKLMICL